MQQEWINPSLTSTVSALRNTETIVPAPAATTTTTPAIPAFPTFAFPSHGPNILLVIPTANADKTRILTTAFTSHLPTTNGGSATLLHPLTVPASSNVGEQPYNGAGPAGAHNRIANALQTLADSAGQRAVLAQHGIGTVMAASIENYIQEGAVGVGGEARPVDYGFVLVHNASTGRTVSAVSRGVTVPRAYYEYARSLGTDGGEDYGRVTAGEVLTANVPGMDKANWHQVVADVSRYDLLTEAIEGLEIPW
ncbi:hypothetical protein B0T25DRAFT_452351 [Lasiosphaeria hispida]|uniref:Non-canonical purine NTP phosphatase/PRRC1 domain-containing protein n=1 Tax=Lasiosphaeria hispida TaxID=260671 RepID=A0AAJ0MGT3_9PEZI|nr:hypothetical protein B0T25DRAFT_452351 [Lasiosphaeria hispida]